MPPFLPADGILAELGRTIAHALERAIRAAPIPPIGGAGDAFSAMFDIRAEDGPAWRDLDLSGVIEEVPVDETDDRPAD